jgi:hypothetical protein
VAPTHTAAIDLASAASNLTTELRLSPGTYRETFDAGVGRFDGCVFENKRSALGGGVINLGAYESPVAACPADLNDRSRTCRSGSGRRGRGEAMLLSHGPRGARGGVHRPAGGAGGRQPPAVHHMPNTAFNSCLNNAPSATWP